jgi:hypothetical protein
MNGNFDPSGGQGAPAPIPRPQVPAPVADTTVIDPFLDPLTGEDIRQDTDITVAFVVVLDPPPPPPPAEGAETAAVQ